jgi:hypothetical protein
MAYEFTTDRPYADPEKAARKLLEIANTVEAEQDGRIYIELINGPFLFREKATPDEYKAGLDLAIEHGWLVLHESGTFCPVHARRALSCSLEALPVRPWLLLGEIIT